jgi:CheY-like chemotaxis protein
VLELSNLPPVECFPGELNQVFMNLIVNAVQAMPEGGILRIGARRKGEGWVSLRFADTDHGIPQELITKIFDPLFTTKPLGSGTGLGLSIAHQIITERHGELEAIALAERLQPEVMLLDIGMPIIDGYETCRRIRAEPWGKSIKIVALTDWGTDEDRRKSAAAGFDAHLVKPAAASTLSQVLGDPSSLVAG